MDTVHRNIIDNVEYVAEQFRKHMNHVTADAKTEIESFLNSAVQRAGIKALAQSPIELIEHKKETKE
jgi:hypothetical protein